MKKFLIGLVLFVVLGFGGLKLFEITNYGGVSYYTKITTTGTKIAPQDDAGNVYTDYRYNQPGYDKQGKAQTLVFNANKSRPLRVGAYLKVTYNTKKGVTAWEAVEKSAVPKPAMQKLK
jgi:uncharacterized protein (TIGR01655 family)